MNRPEVYALRGVELTGTNTPRPFPRFSVFLHIVKESDSWGYMNWISGGQSGGVTPGSMPNPAVKPSFADGTTEGIRGRVGRCQNYIKKKAPCIRTGLFSWEAAERAPARSATGTCRGKRLRSDRRGRRSTLSVAPECLHRETSGF